MFSRRRRNQPRRSCSASSPDAASSGPRAPSAVMNRSSQSRATGMRDDSSVPRPPSIEIEVRVERADEPAGQALLDGFDDEMRERYGEFDKAVTPSATPADMAAPQGAFLVLYAAGEPVA